MKIQRSVKGSRSLFFLTLFFFLLFPLVTRANTIHVDIKADDVGGDGHCSLREAISNANSDTRVFTSPSGECEGGSGDDVIELSATDTDTPYQLTRSGPVDNDNNNGDLDIFSLLIFGDLTINGNGSIVEQTVDNERVFDTPLTDTNLTINDLEIRGGGKNHTFMQGGGIQFAGAFLIFDLNLSNVWIHDNFATDGGGISVSASIINLNDSTISDNDASSDGGGIFMSSSAANFNNSTIADNTAGLNGGGINCSTCFSVQARNVTITGNDATVDGGGFGGSNIILNLKNSILFDNDSPSATNENCFGTLFLFNSEGFNILGDSNGGCEPGTDDIDGNNNDPLLGSLDDHGGPTPTFLPGDGSSAIDAGDPVGCTDTDDQPLTTDQRGVARPQGPDCDIGSVEVVVPSCGDGQRNGNEECDGSDGSECCDACHFASQGTTCSAGTCNSHGGCVVAGGGGSGGSGGNGGNGGTGGGAEGGDGTGADTGGCSFYGMVANPMAPLGWLGMALTLSGMGLVRRRR